MGASHVYPRLHTISCMMLYTVAHTIGLPRVSHSIHIPTIFTIISVMYALVSNPLNKLLD